MSEIEQLKTEARQLLEEVNYQFERTTGKRNTGTVYNFDSISGSSFVNRLQQLKQKIALIRSSSADQYSSLFQG